MKPESIFVDSQQKGFSMDFTSPNLKLSYLAPAQAQKHVTHNEALRQLDALVQLSVISFISVPVSEPQNGDRYIIGPSPEGIFQGHENNVVAYQDGAWSFFTSQIGWRAYIVELSELYIFNGFEWASLQNAETPLLGINASPDMTNRLTVKSSATLLDHEGAGHQLKLNKSAPRETTSLLFQTDYATQAEIGLVGDDNIHLKVSQDGIHFKESLIANRETGSISCPHGINIEKIGSSVADSGGDDFQYGIPSTSVLYNGRQNLTMVQGRVYFSPFYVDRPTKIVGGFIAQYGASATTGSVIRAGLFKLGTASGNDWNIGERVADFGTCPADVAGQKDFQTNEPSILVAGWYACAVGTTGASVMIRNVRTLQSGQSFLVKLGSGTGADLRFSGASSHLYSNNAGTEINNGFSESWPLNPVTDLLTVQPYGYLTFIPKWERWDI